MVGRENEKVDALTTQATKLRLHEYNFEMEVNSSKARVGVYFKKSIMHQRRFEFEGIDSHLIIIDLKCCITTPIFFKVTMSLLFWVFDKFLHLVSQFSLKHSH